MLFCMENEKWKTDGPVVTDLAEQKQQKLSGRET